MEIDLHSPVPSYQQLTSILREQIKSGQLQPGDPLPSLTYLAGETGLAINTIRRSIQLLADEGLVSRVQGPGDLCRRSPGPRTPEA